MDRLMKKNNFFKKIKNLIINIIKSIINFVFPKEELRNIEGIYQLILVFGLVLISFRFLILKDFFGIIKNCLVFICLFLIMIFDKFFDKFLTKEK